MKKFKLLLLISLFIAAFWWAGGKAIVPKSPPLPAISQNQSTTVDNTYSILALKSNLQKASTEIISLGHRSYRIVALKSEISAKLNKTNTVPLSQIPLVMQQAIIAVEDNRFYNHTGFDVEGIIRATLVNMQTGSIQEGGSTITQQLIKNLFLSQEQTFGRKLEEVVLAVDMELRYSKEDILEMYLNSIYFGSGAYGIKEAARIYFAKTPDKLTLPEAALLAGLPNAPSLFSPYEDYYAAKQRQAIVLAAMVKSGMIGPQQAYEAKVAPLHFAHKVKQ